MKPKTSVMMRAVAVSLSLLVMLGTAVRRASATEADDQGQTETRNIQEVVVTAQKREQSLEDVPVPVSVISAATLLDNNQLSISDYFSDVPGLNLATGSRGELFPSIRGITAGTYTTPTVGITVDDVPVGSAIFSDSGIPDIDPSDLKQIEVLRGPQGTLYGVSSMGGLLKYVTIDPSTTETSGRVEAGTDSVYNGAELGYNFRAAANVPLTDSLAIRVSGFTRQDPGYIDNPVRDIDGVNEAHDSGGRVSLLWAPSDMWSVKLGAQLQNFKQDGSSEAFLTTGFGDLQQNMLPNVGGISREVQLYSAIVNAKLGGGVELTSVSAFNHTNEQNSVDDSPFLGSLFQPIFGVTGAAFTTTLPVNKFSQELRFTGSMGQLDWLAGGFYTHESYTENYHFEAYDSGSGAPVGSWGGGDIPGTFEEYAAFADLTVHVTDRLDVQLGARQSHDNQTLATSTYVGDYAKFVYGTEPYVSQTNGESENPFTYLFTPSFKITPDWMMYARVASGFRPGGGNTAFAALYGQPPTYGPDKTQNYELGMKGDAVDHAYFFDLSVYRIDWKDIQLSLNGAHGSYFVNGPDASSEGVEFSTTAKPVRGMSINAWVTFSRAVLSQALPPDGAVGPAGAPLPYGSRRSGNLSIQQQFPITGRVEGVLAASESYVGRRYGDFGYGPDNFGYTGRAEFSPYAETNLRAAVMFDSWTVNLFVNNVTDKRGELGGGLDNTYSYGYYLIQPRTVGLSIARTF